MLITGDIKRSQCRLTQILERGITDVCAPGSRSESSLSGDSDVASQGKDGHTLVCEWKQCQRIMGQQVFAAKCGACGKVRSLWQGGASPRALRSVFLTDQAGKLLPILF